jgi:hypothetical protein
MREGNLSLEGCGLIDLPLRASNEDLLSPRIARAQKIIRLHPTPVPGAQDQRGCPSHPSDRAHSASRRTIKLPVLCCGLLYPNFSAMACRGENPNEHIG